MKTLLVVEIRRSGVRIDDRYAGLEIRGERVVPVHLQRPAQDRIETRYG